MKDKALNFGKNFLKHELVSGSFYIFIGSISANILAFFLNLFLARTLSYADYAIFTSLLSVITLASIPAGSMSTIIVRFAADCFSKRQNNRLKTLYLLFFKFILGVSLFIVIAFLILAVPIRDFLHLGNVWYVIVAGLSISAAYLNMLNNSFLQGMLKFGFISFITAFGGLIKLIFGVLLVFLGYRAYGGLWAIFFMTFGMYIVAFFPLAGIFKEKSSDKKISLDKKEIFSYAVPTFIAILFLTSFTTTDVILVKHFFNPYLAGYYAGLSLIGKVIFYITFPIPMVMFPLLVKRRSTGGSFVNLFYLALIFVIFPSLTITVFYFLFPDFVINFFLGGRKYLYVSGYLGIFGLYLTIFSIVNVCVNFFLSLNKMQIVPMVVAAAVLQAVLIAIFHETFSQVIGVSILASFLLLAALLIYYVVEFGRLEKASRVAYIQSPPAV